MGNNSGIESTNLPVEPFRRTFPHSIDLALALKKWRKDFFEHRTLLRTEPLQAFQAPSSHSKLRFVAIIPTSYKKTKILQVGQVSVRSANGTDSNFASDGRALEVVEYQRWIDVLGPYEFCISVWYPGLDTPVNKRDLSTGENGECRGSMCGFGRNRMVLGPTG